VSSLKKAVCGTKPAKLQELLHDIEEPITTVLETILWLHFQSLIAVHCAQNWLKISSCNNFAIKISASGGT